ncbi:MAG: FliM/FliN family flagellar motor switch protein [Fimbriimonadaceae bacterium]|nr:FliM/FliN family flagellar motor switch protein [Fimbriimonadaceae bacterium]
MAGDSLGAAYEHLSLVTVTLRAELGRCTMRFRDAQRLGPGSVVTIDRLAGEPVELLCHGQVLARGEVVIQDERFAIRVTEIVDRRLNAQRDRPGKLRATRRK